jgi:hypothetical protein
MTYDATVLWRKYIYNHACAAPMVWWISYCHRPLENRRSMLKAYRKRVLLTERVIVEGICVYIWKQILFEGEPHEIMNADKEAR